MTILWKEQQPRKLANEDRVKRFLPIGNEFQKIFGVSFGKFVDMRFLLARKELVFNLLKFTDWLEECYPDECSIDGVSYNAVVERKFGKRGVKMIKKLIG